jgi:hypothetical protein
VVQSNRLYNLKSYYTCCAQMLTVAVLSSVCIKFQGTEDISQTSTRLMSSVSAVSLSISYLACPGVYRACLRLWRRALALVITTSPANAIKINLHHSKHTPNTDRESERVTESKTANNISVCYSAYATRPPSSQQHK